MKNTKDSTKKYLFIVPDAYAENQGELTQDAIQRIFKSYKNLSGEVDRQQSIPFVDVLECPDNFWVYLQNGIILEGGITEWARSYFDFSKVCNSRVICITFSTAQKYSQMYLGSAEETQQLLVTQLNEVSQQIVGMSRFRALYLDKVETTGGSGE